MNGRDFPQTQQQQHPQSTEESEKGVEAPVALSPSVNSASCTKIAMKVQDRILAMNKLTEQEEFVEPLSDGKSSSGNFTKRSSVVEMWKKREGAIKASPSIHKCEGTKEKSVKEYNRQPTAFHASLSSHTHLLTLDRNASESGESKSNVGNNIRSVRRSNIRDSWRKRAPHDGSSSTPCCTTTVPVVSPDSARGSPLTDRECPNTGLTPANSGNDHSEQIELRRMNSLIRTTRRIEHSSKPLHQQIPESPKSTGKSLVDHSQSQNSGAIEHPSTGSSSAFDELRSKWAKFGVQQEKARPSNLKTGTSIPSSIRTRSPKAPTTYTFRKNENTSDEPKQNNTAPSYSPLTPISRFSVKPTESQMGEGSRTPPTSGKNNDEATIASERKNHFVKRGQMHASRPRAETQSSPKTPSKNYTPSKFSPKQSDTESLRPESLEKTGLRGSDSVSLPVLSEQCSTHKTIDPKIRLRAKHRRRAQQAQSAAAVSQRNGESENWFLPAGSIMIPDTLIDSSAIEKMGPGTLRNETNDRTSDRDAIRLSLPMRTLFSSESGESLDLGPVCKIADSDSGEPRATSRTNVVENTFDTRSEIEPFSAEDQRDSEDNKLLSSGSSLTNHALRRLREKRQNHAPQVSDGVGHKPRGVDWPETSTPQIQGETSGSDQSSLYFRSHQGLHSPVSLDASAISSFVGSDTSLSNSQMQSTCTRGYTKGTAPASQHKKDNLRSSFNDVVLDAKEMIPDEFVSEKNASVLSFRTAYESLSLEQIANDMKEEASSALRIDFLSHDLLNKSMHAAGESLNKLVAGEIFQRRNQQRLIERPASPVEEIAIEVEYIADSGDER